MPKVLLDEYKAQQESKDRDALKQKVSDLEDRVNRLRACCSWRER